MSEGESETSSDDPDLASSSPRIKSRSSKRSRTKDNNKKASRSSNNERKSSSPRKEEVRSYKRHKHDHKQRVVLRESKEMRQSVLRDSSESSVEDCPKRNNSKRVPRELALSKEDTEFIQKEAELARHVCETQEQSVVEDATDLIQHLADSYDLVSKSFNKPNVLVTGITGVGKSTLINAMFGEQVAVTGSGIPITQHFTKYDSPNSKTTIYDSKGLEHGQYQEFIEGTEEFFKAHQAGSDGQSKDAIHVVWYVVNAAHARFEPFEQELCEQLFSHTPIFFLLNKSDLSTQEDRDNMRKVIRDMNLSNCCGVLDIIADCATKYKCCDLCPNCGSDDLMERRKSGLMICADCGHKESIIMDHGLESVVKATIQVLPSVVRENFVAAQNVSFYLKEETSHGVITEFWEDFTVSRSNKDLLRIITRMIARLSLVWEFTGHSKEIGTLLASDLVTSLKWKTKNNGLWKRKKVAPSESQRLHVTSLGILWNMCLRELAQQLVSTWADDLRTSGSCVSKKWNATCSALFQGVFSAMNEQNLKHIESELCSSYDVEDFLSHADVLKIL